MSTLLRPWIALIPEVLIVAYLLAYGVTTPSLRVYIGVCLLARWATHAMLLKV